MNIKRSIKEPIRPEMPWDETWKSDDRGFIFTWEKGRMLASKNPELASQAGDGHFVVLPWQGGVERKLKETTKKYGSFYYLAMWQGLREENLNLDTTLDLALFCTRFDQKVTFTSDLKKLSADLP